MWVLSGNLDADCNKTRSIWLRPSRELLIGRPSSSFTGVLDLSWPAPKSISREHLKLTASEASPQILQEGSEQEPHTLDTPTYNITLESPKKTLEITRGDGTTYQLEAKHDCVLSHGDAFAAGGNANPESPRNLKLTWQPIAIDLADFPATEGQSTAERLSSYGIRSTVNRIHPQLSHYCRFRDLTSKDSTFLHASLLSKYVVSYGWLQALLVTTQVESPSANLKGKSKEDIAKLRNQDKAGSDPRFWGFSNLEQDFEQHWPSETGHFPKWSIEQEQSAFANTKRWSSISTQSKLFTGLTFIIQGPRGSPKLSSTEHVIESNNGTCFHVHLSLIRPADKSKIKGAIDELLADTEGEDRSARAFCLFDSLDEDREEVARSAAKEAGLAGTCTVGALYEACYNSFFDAAKYRFSVEKKASPSMQEEPEASRSAASFRDPSRAPSTHGIPSTNPEENTMPPASDRRQPSEPAAEPAPSEPPPTRRRALVKRANSEKDSADPLGALFGLGQKSTLAAPAPAPAERSNSRSTRSRSASQDVESAPKPSEAPTPEPTPSNPRRSRLTKRAGTAQGFDAILGGSQDMFENSEQKRKKAKLDAIYETQDRAASQQLESQSRSAEPEAEVVPQKRKQQESQEVSEARKRVKRREEAEERARDHRAAERAKSDKTELTSAKDEAAAKQRENERKYLQADTASKRKQKDQMDMAFSKEFNALKITRPALKPPKQVEGQKDNWNNLEDAEGQDEPRKEDWNETSGPGFFVVRQLPASAFKPAEPATARLDPLMQGHWAGMPNYKKFKPKKISQQHHS